MFALFGILASSGAFMTQPFSKSEHSHLGDVKYSILPPEVFNNQHSGTWVPLEGGKIRDDWELTKLAKREKVHDVIFTIKDSAYWLPDARGTFVRSMNHNGGIDPDTTRRVGVLQDDMTAYPKSPFVTKINYGKIYAFGGTNLSSKVVGSGKKSFIGNYHGSKNHNHEPSIALYGVHSPQKGEHKEFRERIGLKPLNDILNRGERDWTIKFQDGSGDVETRPKNIALYTYIRVD